MHQRERRKMAAAVTGDDGGSFIAASQRPDGTWRKPRRVKEGYTPQDEVPLYESKGKNITKRSNQYPVGLDPALIHAAEARKEKQQGQWTEVTSRKNSPIPGLVITDKKKKKPNVEALTEGLAKVKVTKEGGKKDAAKKPEKKAEKKAEKKVEKKDEETGQDPAKRVKNLRKRLREIEAIELKIASGELKKLEKDQLDKVARKKDYLAEIEQLEFAVK